MTLADIAAAAEKRLAENTGFASPKAVGVNLEDGLYHVTVEIIEKKQGDPSGEILRAYDVAVDSAGSLHGYSPLQK